MCTLAKKKAVYKYIDLTVGAYEEYFDTSFFFFFWKGGRGESYSEFIVLEKEGWTNQMNVHVRGRAEKIFHFVEVC